MTPWRPSQPLLARRFSALRCALRLLALAAALGVVVGCADDAFDSQGTAGSPVDLGTAPLSAYAGSVGPDNSSYYFVRVTNPTQYAVSLYELTDDADLGVFENSFSGATFCGSINNGTTSESCTATTKTGVCTLYIQVKPFSETGTKFLLTAAALGIAPSVPSCVVAAPGGVGQVSVSWSPVSGATSYNLYRASVTGVTAVNYAGLADGMAHIGVTSPKDVTGLTSATTYYFIVTAVSAGGESAASTEVNALVP